MHPRPQLTRAEWESLDGLWQFAEDPDEVGVNERWFESPTAFTETIVVPFPPESPASQIGRDVSDVIWYRRSVELAPPPPGRARLVHFEAIDYRCSIWVNGVHLADHEGGQTRITVDATSSWSDGENTIVVRAVDERRDIEQPRGKQDWNDDPHVIWYRRTSGIWRSVWLEDVPAVRLQSVLWTPQAAFGVVELDARFVGGDGSVRHLDIRLSHRGRTLSQSSHALLSDRLRVRLTLDDPAHQPEPDGLLWSPENPELIEASLVLRGESGPADEVGSYFGLRTVGADDRSFLLNNKPYFLRLVLEQGYWPETHLATPSEDALRREVELIKQLGFNGLRMHQTVADPRFLAWCDRLGLLVLVDAAASYQFSSRSLARTTREWMEIVERDSSHPSIAVWVAFNESWGVPEIALDPRQRDAALALFHLLRALDGSRLVVANDGWEYVAGDLAGIHDYSHDPSSLRRRFTDIEHVRETFIAGRTGGRRASLLTDPLGAPVPVILSEFGGINLTDSPETWEGYGSAGTGAEFLATLADLLAEVGSSSGLAGFCYTQLTDTLQERNGLLTGDRVHKVEPAAVAAIIRGTGTRS